MTTISPRLDAVASTACVHCGLPVPAALLEPEGHASFCCGGCATAYAIIHEGGLDRYYRLPERRAAPVAPSGRSFEEFDHPAFHALYVRIRPDGMAETELYLDGVHCASCVWLVERVPLMVPGVLRAELEVGRALAHITWDPGTSSLGQIARFLDTLGYRPHPFRAQRVEQLRRAEDRTALLRIGVAGALAGNVMMLAVALYGGWFGGMEPAFVRYFRWMSLLLTAPILLWPGRVFFQGALASLRTRRLHMDLPIAIALGAGFARGAMNTVTDSGPIYFDGVAMLVFLLLVGRFLQQRAQRAATDATSLLHGLTPSVARAVEGEAIREIPAEALLPEMTVEVRAGETFPADGVVVQGDSLVDLALLTGESRPVRIEEGSKTWAGTVNLGAAIRVRVTEAGEMSRVGRLVREVAAGAGHRARIVLVADRLAGWFVAVVLVLAVLTWIYWHGVQPEAALDNAIALLIVTCPCALALATPLAVTVAIGRAARRGILVRGGDALEALARPAAIYLDKTGTVTEGKFRLARWDGPEWIQPLVVALERHSSHPVAAGFLEAWPHLEAPVAAAVRQTLGGGIEGRVAGHSVAVGSPVFVRAFLSSTAADAWPEPPAGLSPVWVAVDGALVGVAAFGDPLRGEALDVMTRLRRRGWSLHLLSGDAEQVVRSVARALGLAGGAWRGAVSPEGKLAVIEEATLDGPVVMVGDGVNDAAAMARATVGIAVRGGAEASLAVADVYLARPGLEGLDELMAGAERTLRVIRRNIAFSLAYNIAGAALAVGGWINPLIAAILMPASSLTVVLASWRSRTFEEGA
ncbi:MAG TPA: heavy metal translocating P-type ATPase [Gemmatimonadales bacterium]|nr:heavy metal translocating P-type ATPase [Gemmatimonadales bacterium]